MNSRVHWIIKFSFTLKAIFVEILNDLVVLLCHVISTSTSRDTFLIALRTRIQIIFLPFDLNSLTFRNMIVEELSVVLVFDVALWTLKLSVLHFKLLVDSVFGMNPFVQLDKSSA